MPRYRVTHSTVAGEKRWGFSFTDERGRRKTTILHPRTREAFRTRADVERYIDTLQGDDAGGADVTVEELARHLFRADGPWADRQQRRRNGRPLAPGTLREHEMHVRLHVIPRLGKEKIGNVDMQMIDDFLYALDMSNRNRRNVASTLKLIFKEAARRRIIKAIPLMELPSKKSRKPNVLTLEDLKRLFPRDLAGLARVWAPGREQARPESAEARFAIAGCAAVMFFGGLRPQEARAVGVDQLHRETGILLVTRSMTKENQVSPYLKMGDERDPRYRGTLLIDWALEVLDAWLPHAPKAGFLFTWGEKPLGIHLLEDRLRQAIEAAGISTEGRRFTPYSGRFSFLSTVRPFLPASVMMALMGHSSEQMEDHYNVPVLLERMKQLAPYRADINRAIEGAG